MNTQFSLKMNASIVIQPDAIGARNMERFKNMFGGYMKRRFPLTIKNNYWIELFNDCYIDLFHNSGTLQVHEGEILEAGEKIDIERLGNLFTRRAKQILGMNHFSKKDQFRRSTGEYELQSADGEVFENPGMAKYIMGLKESNDCGKFQVIIKNLLQTCSNNKTKRYQRLLALASVMDLETDSKELVRYKLHGDQKAVWLPKRMKLEDENILLILNKEGSEYYGLFANVQDLRTFKSTLDKNMPDELKVALLPLYSNLK